MMVVGNYEYDKKNKLGQGSFGKVYKGHEKPVPDKNVQAVAIKKVYAKSRIVQNDFPHSIKRETGIMKTLSNPTHTNIVTLLHYENQADHVYFVMEYCNGGNLQEYLLSKRKLDERTLNIFLRQIAAGLRAAHDVHIVHRDLKPENILLCFSGSEYPDPDRITLKIVDFGIGRFLDENEMAHTNCGTLLYMAPEIFLRRGYDYKVDLWSVGMISYECLGGSMPTDSRFPFRDVELPTSISPDAAHLLTGLLQEDENNRFDTKQLFNHPFLAATIQVRVVGNDRDQAKMIHVEDNRSLDHLIDIVSAKYVTDSESALLYHEDGRSLERGSGNSLRESGIVHNNTVTLILKLSGGNDNDRTLATLSS